MKIIKINEKKDKNSNPLKVLTMENEVVVFVNSKYDKEIFDIIDESKDVEIVKDGEYWRIMPESLGIQPKPKTFSKTGQITEAVKLKTEGIHKAQEFRNDSIKTASASRDASLMVTTLIPFLYKNLTETELQVKWQEWRKWFFERIGDNPADFSQPF